MRGKSPGGEPRRPPFFYSGSLLLLYPAIWSAYYRSLEIYSCGYWKVVGWSRPIICIFHPSLSNGKNSPSPICGSVQPLGTIRTKLFFLKLSLLNISSLLLFCLPQFLEDVLDQRKCILLKRKIEARHSNISSNIIKAAYKCLLTPYDAPLLVSLAAICWPRCDNCRRDYSWLNQWRNRSNEHPLYFWFSPSLGWLDSLRWGVQRIHHPLRNLRQNNSNNTKKKSKK